MYSTWHQDHPERLRRSNRSRNGCLTCRRRKVRCDEQRPRCGHCCRLYLDCTWKAPGLSPESDHTQSQSPSQLERPSPSPTTVKHQNLSLEEMFDFAHFLWSDTNTPALSDTFPVERIQDTENSLPIRLPDPNANQQLSAQASNLSENTQLLHRFQHAKAPPILTHVETQPRWNSMRDLLLSMASTSLMVRYAILAYSLLQLQRENGGALSDFESFYARSQEEISFSLLEDGGRTEIIGAKLPHVLAALFLLSYIDLVINRTNYAQVNLEKAFGIVSSSDYMKFDAAEKTLISWIRLLDARAVTAGGEGLFLREERESCRPSRSLSPSDKDPEAVVSQFLSEPSLKFFQRTQLFMGRISKIDQWHRSRGTVEDESEVMAVAAQIRADNHKLYQHRHPLLDLAMCGRLEAPLVAQSLAERITRSSRVALANYHATFIHLHRVAYRHLPRTTDVIDAMKAIQQITHSMVEAQGPDDSVPVNMLWPLLMWGAEEESLEERAWILSTIRNMSSAVSNAAITADVLHEVWQRQDSTGQRSDIRTVMHHTFNSCFAIV